jgi:hypothetical protein
VDILEAAQEQNSDKAELLTMAPVAEVIAVAFVALGISVVLSPVRASAANRPQCPQLTPESLGSV